MAHLAETPTENVRYAHRGALLSFRSDPGEQDHRDAYDYWSDGMLVTRNGRVENLGPARALLPTLSPDVKLIDHGDGLILPGFIDTHIHYPQTDVIASGGKNLLHWLEDYTFPAERRFAQPEHAAEVAEFFLDELLSNGTTTAQVLGTVHRVATEKFFEAAAQRQLRMIAGKVLMDRNCPEYLCDTAVDGERDSRELIEAWNGHERLHYAITPRFAPTSSEAQLASAGRLAREYPDTFIHSHLAENHAEIAWVQQLFPHSRSYLDVYDRFGLLRERATYAHCIHMDAADRSRMAATGASAAFSPTSNLYLGSGLFDIAAADHAGLRFALATDVGGGSSFSMLRTMGEAYKVAQLLGQSLTPLRAFYLATLGSARVLGLDDRIGRFTVGAEADFIVLDLNATPLLSRRTAQSKTLAEKLLLLMTLGDDRAIAATYVLGEPAKIRRVRASPA
jgi:guanine deaminase